MKKSVWIVFAVTLIGCSKRFDTCEKYLRKEYLSVNLEHERFYKEGKLVKAISMVEEIVKKDSSNYIAINYLGAYKYELCNKNGCSVEDLKAIYDHFKKSVDLCDNYRLGHFNTIEILSELSKSKYENDNELIEHLEIYNSRYAKRSNLLTKGGEAMFRLGKIEESLRYLNQAIELDSTEAMAYIFKGKCYISQREWGKALEYLNHGLSLDSLSLGFHERGYVKYVLGNIEDAVRDFNTSIFLYDERFESYLGLGQIEIDRNNIGLACHYFRKARELKPDSKNVKLYLDQFCENQKQLPD